jgi:hypothetical protein
MILLVVIALAAFTFGYIVGGLSMARKYREFLEISRNPFGM